ncbi:MAG: heavy-metal-associated domain-containing protein [Hydrogeniiclostridium sp.]
MVRYIVAVEGMQCSMCEAHVNDAVRDAFQVKKVSSSHTKKQTVIVANDTIDEEAIRNVIDNTGYKVLSVHSESYKKKGLFIGDDR